MKNPTTAWILLIAFEFALGSALPASAFADEPTPASANKAGHVDKKRKELEFDDGLVEGLNKRPGEFASKATNWKARKRTHLYSKDMSFERDQDETVREARYSR